MVRIATGETIPLVYKGEEPEINRTELATCYKCGIYLEREAEGIRLGWAFILGPPRGGKELRKVTKVTVDEVSGPKVVTMFSGEPDTDGPTIMVIARRELVSKKDQPWLYDGSRAQFIFRLTLEREGQKPDVLYQPVIVSPYTKQQLKQNGYLP